MTAQDPSNPLRIALVGPGHMGRRHANAYAAMPDVRVVGVVGVDADDAQPVAGVLGCPTFRSLDDLFASVEADAVDLCTPTPLHKADALTAARAGKHVLCEKPLARTLSDAEAMVQACHTAGVHLLVGHVLRFFPQYAQARSTVLSGALGQPSIVRTFRGNGFPQGWKNWYADPEQSGGLLLDLVLHDFDWLYWTFGEVERVYARGLMQEVPQGRDYALVTLRHRSGVLAHVEGTWCHTTPFNMKLEVAGDAGLLDYDDSQARPVRFTPRVVAETDSPKVAVPESPLAEDPYFLELRHFVDVLHGRAEPLITPQEALAALRIALAAIESVETGKAVTLS
jgi:UDP-N-acetylglucosamine 3-dehydrogenase